MNGRELLLAIFAAVVCAVSAQQSTYKKPEAHIFGGSLATIGDHPYQASLRYDQLHICSSAIISKDWAITIAQCFSRDYLNLYTVKTGSATLGQGDAVGVHLLAAVAVHPNYDPLKINFDIALFKVATPFMFGASVSAIALPEQGRKTPSGFAGMVSGWVRRETSGEFVNELQHAKEEVTSQDDCQRAYYGVGQITEEKICAGSTGCLSDAGAPFVIENVLIGVASWNQLCSDMTYPTVFTRVASVREWIDQQTQETTTTMKTSASSSAVRSAVLSTTLAMLAVAMTRL